MPVGAEGESTAGVAQKAVDLVIPGSEDTTRVLKKVDDGLTAQHFTSEAEAQAVAENMQDPQWVKENCGACAPIIVSSQYYRRSTNHINRRGNSFSSCCKAPATLLESAVDLDTTADGGGLAYETSSEGEQDLDDQLHDPIYDPENYNTIVETDLVQAPQYKLRDVSIANDLQGLQQDLDGMSTGLIPWSAPLQAVTSSDEVFATLRRVFTSETDPLYKLLDIEEREGKFRLISFSQSWISKIDPALKPLQDFVNAAVQQAIDTVAKLQKLSAADTANLRGSIEFFYVAPSEKALTGVDPRGFHIDAGMMQFGAADTPGLIVRNTATGTASRVPVVKNTFQLVKARNWDMEAYLQDLPNGPTWHSVFGPEMSRNGRVSMVMSVFVTGTYI